MATTNINQVYPPIVNSSISAFTTKIDQLAVSFTLPMTVNYNNVKYISIRVVQQSNNKSVVNTEKYFDGIIYQEKPASSINGVYTTYINTSDIKTNGNPGWAANIYYKIQIRFGYGELINYNLLGINDDDIDEKRRQFFLWKKSQVSISGYSEWSNIIITKAINKPIVNVLNNSEAKFLYASSILRVSDNVEHTRFPKFQGGYYNDAEEPLDKYRFRLYEGRFNESDYDYFVEPFMTSGWLQFNGSGNSEYSAVVEYTFKTPLKFLGATYYTVIFDTISKNEYHCSSSGYTFTVTEGILNPLNHLTLVVKDNSNSGYYAQRFYGANSNVFSAYKKLVGLASNSTYLRSEGTTIYYTVQPFASSYSIAVPTILNENSEDQVISEFETNTKIKRTDYENGNVKLQGIFDKLVPYLDENNVVKYTTKKEYAVYKYGIDYTCDFIEIKEPILDDQGHETNEEKKFDVATKIKMINDIVNICGGKMILTLTENEKALTLNERINTVSAFEQNLRCDENGVIEIYLKNNTFYVETEKFDDVTGFSQYEQSVRYQSLDGIYYLIRSDERSNYSVWEDIAKFDMYDDQRYDNQLTLLYEDFTIESGVRYKYALQRESLQGFRSVPKYEFNELETSPAHFSNFQYSYIYANGVQVRLDLDVKMQQFKHTRLFQKQDSLNSKYPVILRNGLANYGEFSLGAKITLHSDSDGSFFMRDEELNNMNGEKVGGYYYNNDLVISADKYLEVYSREKYWYDYSNILKGYHGFDLDTLQEGEDYPSLPIVDGSDIGNEEETTPFRFKIYPSEFTTLESQTHSKFNTDHTNDNIFMERIYRQYVEAFLNDGGYKLYKSPTEGNMIVTLTNVVLVPNQQLGRLIADFSSTVYEVAENTCDNIKLYDINPLDVVTNNMYLAVGEPEGRYRSVVGQIRGAFDGQYTKCMKITSDMYQKLHSLNLAPYNYFSYAGNDNYYSYDQLPHNIVAAIYDIIKNEQDTALDKIKEETRISLQQQLDDLEKQYINLIKMYDIETLKQISLAKEHWSKILDTEYSSELKTFEDNYRKDKNFYQLEESVKQQIDTILNDLDNNKQDYLNNLENLDKTSENYQENFENLTNSYKEHETYLYNELGNIIQLNQFYDNKQTDVEKQIQDLYQGYQKLELERYTRFYQKNKDELEEQLSLVDTIQMPEDYITLNNFSLQTNPYWDKDSDNLVDWIKLQEETEVSEERIYKVNNISMIWVELYPKHNIEQELAYLKSITYDTKVNKLRQKLAIAKYELILKQYELSQSNPITLIIDGKEIMMMPGRVYHLDNTNIKSIYLKYTRPILINYVAEIEETDFLPKITLAKQELTNIGQLAGVFTNNDNILNNYRYDANPETLTVSENYNYNLYRSLDILSIIKEKVKANIYGLASQQGPMSVNVLDNAIDTYLEAINLQNLSFEEQVQEGKRILRVYQPLLNVEKNSWTDVWLDNNGHYIIYNFNGLELLSIEADEGTEINFYGDESYINGTNIKTNESNVISKIGPTNKLVLKTEKDDSFNEINYIRDCKFTKPSYAIIDYYAIVSLEIKGNPKGG